MLSVKQTLALSLAFLSVVAVGQERHPVTLDWALNDANNLYTSCWTAWVKEHDLLLQDTATGGFDRMDPSSGTKIPIGDAGAMLSSLKAAGGPQLRSLPSPDAMDPDGKAMAFRFDG